MPGCWGTDFVLNIVVGSRSGFPDEVLLQSHLLTDVLAKVTRPLRSLKLLSPFSRVKDIQRSFCSTVFSSAASDGVYILKSLLPWTLLTLGKVLKVLFLRREMDRLVKRGHLFARLK